jgi:hypothetical protein
LESRFTQKKKSFGLIGSSGNPRRQKLFKVNPVQRGIAELPCTHQPSTSFQLLAPFCKP